MNEKAIKILDISYYMTCPPVSGGALRIISPYMEMTMEDNISVDFLFSTWEKEYVNKCRDFLMNIPVVNSVTGVITRHYLNTEEGSPQGFSKEVWVTISRELQDKAIEMVKNTQYDVIQIEHSQLAWIVPSLRLASPQSKFVLDLHNAEYLIYQRWSKYARPEEKHIIETRYKTMYDWECKVWGWFDAVFTVSSIEAQMVKEIGHIRHVFTVPTGGGIDVNKYTPEDDARNQPYDLLYLGTMEWYPNAQGLLWFIEKVFPIILKEMPQVKLNIVGFGNPMGDLVKAAKAHPSIKFWGEQKDDKKFFHGSKVFIVPLWIGAGARVKIPTAWASKIPIVSTNLGAEGLDARHMDNIILADEPYEFAAGVIKLLQDESLLYRIIENAHRTVKEEYTVQKCVELLKKGYQEILSVELSDNETNFLNKLTKRIDLNKKTILEIGCGAGSLTRKIAQNYPSSNITGVDPFLREWWGMTNDLKGSNWNILNGDGESLQFPDNSFDLVISLASFEHIANPEKCLTEIRRVLRPNGEFFTDFAPIWSCIMGHHWNHWDAEKTLKIPPWGHLYMNYDEMFNYLKDSEGNENAKQVCEEIYKAPKINRKDIKYLKSAFLKSGLQIKELAESKLWNRLTWVDGTSINELTDDIYMKLKSRYTKQELYVGGLMVHLKKK